MHRNDLPRVYELRDLLPDPVPVGAYFAEFDDTLTSIPVKKVRFVEIEADLQSLDGDAWAFLKAEVRPLLTARQPGRGWQQLFDKLNQAKAYKHLRNGGCTGLRFIPERNAKGKLTPDIEAKADGRPLFCEVKTINISDVEVDRRSSGGVGTSIDKLPEPFFGKLNKAVCVATKQLRDYDTANQALHIVFIVVTFDDGTCEYADSYVPQLEAFSGTYAVSGPDVWLCYRGQWGTEEHLIGGRSYGG